ncbi:MAG: CotH kinase family protein [Muribaculaceae bacterium]|nr:CotH kinase family protein [Muribaculaceae bacterium]
MKKLLLIFINILLVSALHPVNAADLMDGEGYPILYIRGAFNNWAAAENYRMTRTGDHYSITLKQLDGDFKAGSNEWGYNYGTVENKKLTITQSTAVEAMLNGQNFIAENLHNVKIEFDVKRDNNGNFLNTTILFTVEEKPVPGVSGTLPVLYINVYGEDGVTIDNEIISRNLSHKNYFQGNYWLDLNGCEQLAAMGAQSIGSEESPLPLQIKARGNFTRKAFSKKPFKLKLEKKQSMLGLTKSKHFALLAHADDNYGYMRNFTGFNLGKRLGLPWTPWQQPVEVVINGNYRGLYFLTESIRVDADRVDIQELDDLTTDPALISGGYIVELDNYDEDNQIRMPEKSCVHGHNLDALRITWDTPEDYSDIQKQFITDQFTAMNDYVGANSDQLWSYMDLDDAARYYLAVEIISHVEAYHGSTYLFRDRGEGQKWHFSPLWDCGNAFNGSETDFLYNCDPFGNTWIPSMRANATFNAKVKATWLWFMQNRYDGLTDDIDAYCSLIAEAAKADRRRWENAPLPDYEARCEVVDNSDIQSRKQSVLRHLSRKIEWLKGQFGDYTAGTYSEPERDTTPAAPLPSYAGVDDVIYDQECAPAEYYNLQGIRVAHPAKGELYIFRQGNKSSKIIY